MDSFRQARWQPSSGVSNGVAKVETQLSFVNQLVNLLTLGIYTPMEIRVVCAAAAQGPEQPSAITRRRRPAPQPAPAPQRAPAADAPQVPSGMHWVADSRNRVYYPIECDLIDQIPEDDRLYFMNESAPKTAGFIRGEGC
jgi:hypothetical protein